MQFSRGNCKSTMAKKRYTSNDNRFPLGSTALLQWGLIKEESNLLSAICCPWWMQGSINYDDTKIVVAALQKSHKICAMNP